MWAKGARGQTEPQSTFCYNVHVKHAQISNHDISVKQKASDYSVSTFFPLILDKCDDAFCLWGGSQSEENWARTEHQTALKIIIQLWMWIQVLRYLPGLCPEAVCLCEGEEGGLVCPSGPCWALDPGAAVGGGPGSPHLSEEDGLRADLGGRGHLRSAGLVWVGLWKSHRHKCKYRTDL